MLDILGKFTRPKELYVDSLGDYWVPEPQGFPEFYLNPFRIRYSTYFDDSKFEYVYREVTQNRLGKWVKKDTYLGKHKPLTRVSTNE